MTIRCNPSPRPTILRRGRSASDLVALLLLAALATVAHASPNIHHVERKSPTTEETSADTLTWLITFSEAVEHAPNPHPVDPTDFVVTGTTATLSLVPLAVDGEGCSVTWDATLSGGDLATLNGTVTISPAASVDIWGCLGDGEEMTHPEPRYTNENTFILTNQGGTPPPEPTVTFAAPAASAGEDAGTHKATVNLSLASASAVTLHYTVAGTAVDGSDYSIAGMTNGSGTLNVPSLATTADIPVAVTDDSDDEDDETVVLTLVDNAGYAVGSANTHTLTITDNDETDDNDGDNDDGDGDGDDGDNNGDGSGQPTDPGGGPAGGPGGGTDGDDDDGGGEPPEPPPPTRPAASFSLEGADCTGRLCTAFTGSPVTLLDTSAGAVARRAWSIAGRRVSTSGALRHVWSEPGYYRVSLSVSGAGADSEAERDVLVRPGEPAGSCAPDAETLCLQDERYRVTVEWRAAGGAAGSGQVVPAGTNDSGLFHFFEADNWEILIKVLDGCQFNRHAWVFAAASTNLGYAIRVADTATGAAKVYGAEPGAPAPAVADTKAFPTDCES